MKYKFTCFVLFLMAVISLQAQDKDDIKDKDKEKHEKETRIEESEFPPKALAKITPYLEDAKRVRFYKEVDSLKKSYEVKFRLGKLHYSVEFDPRGELEDVEFIIKDNDIPEESWSRISGYLNHNFNKPRVLKIQQQYPRNGRTAQRVFKDAFQNLILPYINYELIFTSNEEEGFQAYEGLFNVRGQRLSIRKSLVADYDHLLY